MRETNRRKWARPGWIRFQNDGGISDGIQGAEYSGLDESWMTMQGCKRKEDRRCDNKKGTEDGEGRIKGEERKHDR
jgi:hypothetical protein